MPIKIQANATGPAIVNADVISAFFVGLSALFQDALVTAAVSWPQVATLVPCTTRTVDYRWLGDFPELRKWVDEKVVKKLEAYGYSLTNEDFESTIAVKRNDIEDDQTGSYAPRVTAIGGAAARWPDRMLFPLLKNGTTGLCYDGKPFFSTTHRAHGSDYSNYTSGESTPWYLLDTSLPLKPLIYQQRKSPTFVEEVEGEREFMKAEWLFGCEARGAFGYGFWQTAHRSEAALTAESYKAARLAMRSLRNENGEPLDITPNLLVVPPTLEAAANALLKKEVLTGGETNEWFGTADVLVTGRVA